MIAHYTQAAMVSENKRLAVPASVDSIPTSAMQEDHVSMGWSAGLKFRSSLDNLRRILAVELLAAARGIEWRGREGASPASAAVLDLVGAHVPAVGPDRFTAPELADVAWLVTTGAAAAAARAVVPDLH